MRGALFHQVTDFSRAARWRSLGAPSLITRITNDVQQVQMLVLMTCTMLVAAPITAVGGMVMALQEDGPLSLHPRREHPGAGALHRARHRPHGAAVPAACRCASTGVNRVLREQITGMRVVRAFVREPHETARFARPTRTLTDTALRAGRLMAFMFPIVMLVLNALQRRGAVVRRQPHRAGARCRSAR